ncbi:FAD-binding protein [Arenibaculum pallidiluteum]|uniref:FAD-binding protein n=1 Tax=Arenibaculum pallidiluteum TaxID=2812559 RepID=UPI001A96BC46|nr:FAD-binding protein [Arenibaculum pallidiluteum]
MTSVQTPAQDGAPTGPSVLKPATEAQAHEVLRWAVAEEQPVELVGGGTKRAIGRPVQAAHRLDFSGLRGISLYEPEELVLSAAAGTPLAEIEATLAARRQQLAFEPADPGPLFGRPAGTQTLGGVVSANLSGPRRIKAGAARDHVLGCRAVSGHGELFKAGGRVVKNVTGYDLPKLFTGAWGTLVALTEVTLKVLPAPEHERTLLLLGLDDAAAIQALSSALCSPHEVAGAAHLPAAMAAGIPGAAEQGAAVTAIRLEGFAPSVAYRAGLLEKALGGKAATAALEGGASAAFWRAVRDVAPFVARPERAVWRISVAPRRGPAVLGELAARLGAEGYYDWGGGLIWLGTDPAGDAGAAAVRAAVGGEGHATLLRAPEAVRTAVPVFHPQAPALAALSARVKQTYDPRDILNPGRMTAGI